MKYIFDFDDVLFHTTKSLKEKIYEIYEKNSVSREKIKEYNKKEESNGFSLKKLLKHFSLPEELYEEIMQDSKYFVNQDVIEIVKKLGKDNCYIVSYGDAEFQKDKIARSGIKNYFKEMVIVLDDKKKAVEHIAEKYKDEEVIFIDDKESFFENLDFKKYPNLKTILYTGQKLDL